MTYGVNTSKAVTDITAEEKAANTTRYTYDIDGNLLSVTYPASDWNVAFLKYDYNQNNWLQTVTAVLQDGTEAVLREYTYDNYGTVAEIKDYRALSNTGTKVNDPAGRLAGCIQKKMARSHWNRQISITEVEREPASYLTSTQTLVRQASRTAEGLCKFLYNAIIIQKASHKRRGKMEEQKSNEEMKMEYDYAQTVSVPQEEIKENVFLGIIGAFVGSLIGAICIVLLGQFGYIASICGVVMGICALKGYALLGKRMSVKGLIISIILMIIMVYLSNMVSYGLAVAEVFEVDKITGISAVHMLLGEGAIDSGYYFKDLIMLYLFTALGAVPTIKNYLKR